MQVANVLLKYIHTLRSDCGAVLSVHNSLESELENLRDALLKTKLESTSPQPNGKSPSKQFLGRKKKSVIVYIPETTACVFRQYPRFHPSNNPSCVTSCPRGRCLQSAPQLQVQIYAHRLHSQPHPTPCICIRLTSLFHISSLCSQTVSFRLPLAEVLRGPGRRELHVLPLAVPGAPPGSLGAGGG